MWKMPDLPGFALIIERAMVVDMASWNYFLRSLGSFLCLESLLGMQAAGGRLLHPQIIKYLWEG